jgi:hypothetical protein
MYVFSVNAIAKEAVQGIAKGQKVPFIVYINSKNRAGAKKLCVLRLLKAGFHQVEICEHRLVGEKALADEKVLSAHRGLREALDQGYSIHLFDEG